MSAPGFPVWCWRPGGAAAAAAARRAGEAWSAAGGPPIETMPISQGDVVFVGYAADLDAARGGPRLYLAADFLGAALARATVPGADDRAVHDRLARTPWGALTLLTGRRAPATTDAVAATVGGLLEHWPELQPLAYVDFSQDEVSLDEVIALHLGGLLAMWVDRAGPSLQSSLAAAVQSLRSADAEERRDRTVTRLAELAATDPHLLHRDELTDRGRLASLIGESDPDEQDAMAAGDTAAAMTLLRRADRYF